jgi:hypothetical protein
MAGAMEWQDPWQQRKAQGPVDAVQQPDEFGQQRQMSAAAIPPGYTQQASAPPLAVSPAAPGISDRQMSGGGFVPQVGAPVASAPVQGGQASVTPADMQANLAAMPGFQARQAELNALPGTSASRAGDGIMLGVGAPDMQRQNGGINPMGLEQPLGIGVDSGNPTGGFVTDRNRRDALLRGMK